MISITHISFRDAVGYNIYRMPRGIAIVTGAPVCWHLVSMYAEISSYANHGYIKHVCTPKTKLGCP